MFKVEIPISSIKIM